MLAPKAAENLGSDPTNFAGADDVNGLTVDVEAYQTVERKIQFTDNE